MFNRFGLNRVLEPKHVLSTSAWRVDNNREIRLTSFEYPFAGCT